MPKLALLVESFDTQRGGAERAVLSVAKALIARGVEVSVYAPADRPGPELPAPGVRVAVAIPKLPGPLRALALATALPRAARRDGAEVVMACGKLRDADLHWPHGGLHCASRRASSAAGRGLTLGGGARLLRRLRSTEWAFDAIEFANLAACDAGEARFVALSERVRGDLPSAELAERAAVLRNGVDHERFTPPTTEARRLSRLALVQRCGAGPDASLALFCAHQFRLKGLDTAIRAVAATPGVHLAVAGSGKPHSYLKLAKRLGAYGRVSFLGRVEDMVPLYRGADCLLHPSRYDPCSLVVLESLACGLPVVGSIADGATELIPPGGGAVIKEPEAAPHFARALAAVVHDAPTREAAASFRRGWDTVADELWGLVGASG
jgi:UDP-glucose:(heptosyl)LPS alpha-1,3-glucosyltransferase